ncbi:MAG TPA: MraY family glycosyltransferase [Rectinemataceae bacterium]
MPFVSIILSAAISSALLPAIIHFAHKYKLYDRINERKIHNGDIPRLGGVGITLSFLVAYGIIGSLEGIRADEFSRQYHLWPVLSAGTALFVLGLVDDLIDLRARIKFIVQSLAALFIMSFGFRFRVILIPWGKGMIDLGILSFPITYIWIIGVTNAINLIDGLDGLAGGIALISSMTFGIFYWAQGMAIAADISMALAGAAAGFLIYNTAPARIFMGDSGSLFLGFSLAFLPLLGQRSDGAEIGLISASTTLAIPIFDTLIAIYRRKRAGISFFTSDKGHFHHILLRKFQSVSKAVLCIYSINVLLSGAALSTIFLGRDRSFPVKIAALILVGSALFVLNAINTRHPGTSEDGGGLKGRLRS